MAESQAKLMESPLIKNLPESLDYNWKQFTKEFGSNTTNNFQLKHYAKFLRIKNFKCLMRDELLKVKLPLCTIINLHKSNQPGVHWCLIFAKDFENAYFFHSYGLLPTKEVVEFLKPFKNRYHSTFQLQKEEEAFCGQMCLYVLYKLSFGMDFFKIILELSNVKS